MPETFILLQREKKNFYLKYNISYIQKQAAAKA